MEIRRIHPYIETTDPDRSRDFYAEVFGLEVAMREPVVNLRSPQVPSAQLIVMPQGTETPQPNFGIDLGEAAAVDRAHERVLASGRHIVYPLSDEPWGVRRFFFEDPDGRVVNVLAHQESGDAALSSSDRDEAGASDDRATASATRTDAAHATVNVPATTDRAFAAFTEGLGTWWPREFTWSQDVLEAVGMECHEGGLCFEHGPHGFRIDWGRVLAWEPPHRVVFSWQITPERVPEPNPAKAGQVEVGFVERGPEATEIQVTHSGFERHGEGGAGYRAAMAEQGWPHILRRYAATLS